LHIASLAGAWSAIVEGFGGLRQRDDLLALAPRLPTGIARLTFRIRHSGLRLLVDVDEQKVQLRLRDRPDARLPVLLDGERVEVGPDEPVVRAVVPLVPLLPPPGQPAGRAPDPASPRQDASDDAL
jgi:alpha,alpha-trehalose phosphorylase